MTMRSSNLFAILSLVVCAGLIIAEDGVPTAPGWSKPVSVGGPVNTTGWEDSVSIAPDGNTLYFSYADYDLLTYLASGAKKRIRTGPLRGVTPRDMGAILVSTRQGDGWSVPQVLQNVSDPFALNDGPFTQDGRLLVFSGLRTGNTGSTAMSDIYAASWDKTGWTKPVNLGPPVCTKHSESNPWISVAGDLLLFDSDRPGGQGHRDLWQSRKVNGQWQEPVNLGAPVNTAGEEVQPFLTRDGKTLYFAGASRDGQGDHVIYCSQRTATGNWGEPTVIIKNLVGEPTLTADGQRLYFVHIIKLTNDTYDADIMFTERTPRP